MCSQYMISSMHPQPNIHQFNVMFTVYDNTNIKPSGIAALILVYKNQQVTAEFLIVSFQALAILGLSFCQKLKLIERVAILHTSDEPQLLAQLQDIFGGEGCLSTEHHIAADSPIPPVIHPCRRVLCRCS